MWIRVGHGRLTRTAATATAALLAVAVLGGCGGKDGGSSSSSGGYCDDLKSTRASVQGLAATDMTQAKFTALSANIHTIAGEAPSDVKDEWGSLASGIDAFTKALNAAGLTFDDLQSAGTSSGPSIAPAKLEALTTAAHAMSTSAAQSSDAINKEVHSECGFDLGLGS